MVDGRGQDVTACTFWGVHLSTTGTDDITKEDYGGLAEEAFFYHEVQMVIPKTLQNQSCMTSVFESRGVNNEIIDMDNNKTVKNIS